ncbi:hypothetical protein Acr_22g0005450 [Actinidia rufa]|uniref:Uncharacterized protein n=1 Tax=Actinidia rufa TaxID=165716 RepID=A0A7J0GK07_9ERIC|nr:hypothetical protein Acr_22g0005450 [Actinidia rufa]
MERFLETWISSSGSEGGGSDTEFLVPTEGGRDTPQKVPWAGKAFSLKSNHDLALQLKKTQDSNLDLVSVLQEMEETMKKKKVEIENLAMLRSESVDTGKKYSFGHVDNAEVNSSKDVSAEKMRKTSCDSDMEGSTVEHPMTDLCTEFEREDNWNVELQLQQLRESQKNLEITILYLEKTMENKNHEIVTERDLKTRTLWDCEAERNRKLTAKEEEIINLKAELSKALSDKNSEVADFENRGDLYPNKEIEALKEKVQELQRDCNELTDKNLELLLKLKQARKDLPTNSTSFNSSSNECPANSSLVDSESVSNFKYQICQFDKGPPVDTEQVYNVNSPYNLKCTELTTHKELAGGCHGKYGPGEAKCGVWMLEMKERNSKIDTCDGVSAVDGSFWWLLVSRPNYNYWNSEKRPSELSRDASFSLVQRLPRRINCHVTGQTAARRMLCHCPCCWLQVAPILVVNSDSEAVDLAFPSVLPAVGDEVDHSLIGGGGTESSSEVDMAPKSKNLATTLAPKKTSKFGVPIAGQCLSEFLLSALPSIFRIVLSSMVGSVKQSLHALANIYCFACHEFVLNAAELDT